MESIYKFTPELKSVIWGGDKIIRMKGLPPAAEKIGESWELSGVPGHETRVCGGPDAGLGMRRLIDKYGESLLGRKSVEKYGMEMPLLVKIIDARQNLSVQVHPDEDMAQRVHGCHGKTEMWYVMRTEGYARIYAGLNRAVTPEEFRKHVQNGTVMDVVAVSDSEPGASYFLPSGRIHAIGAGNLLAEIQQSSDITYRVFDYGRGRELHLDKAMEAIDFGMVLPDYRTYYDENASEAKLVDCEWFEVSRVKADGSREVSLSSESFSIIVCVEGECEVETGGCAERLKAGDTVLIPAVETKVSVSGAAELLLAEIP